MASKENELEKDLPLSSDKSFMLYLHDLVYMLAAIMIVFLLLFRIVIVSGSSMYQTLWNGDWLLVTSSVLYHDTEGGQDDPGERRADTALFQIDLGILGLAKGDEGTDHQAHCAPDQVNFTLGLAVDQTHQEAGQHQKALDPQNLSQNINDHCSVHGDLLMPGYPGCRRSRSGW